MFDDYIIPWWDDWCWIGWLYFCLSFLCRYTYLEWPRLFFSFSFLPVSGNICGEKNCSHFCIPVPGSGTAVAKCVCRTGYKLVNETQCQRKCSFFVCFFQAGILFSHKHMPRRFLFFFFQELIYCANVTSTIIFQQQKRKRRDNRRRNIILKMFYLMPFIVMSTSLFAFG